MNDWAKWIMNGLLSVIMVLLGVGINEVSTSNKKLDILRIEVSVHHSTAALYIEQIKANSAQIKALQNGQHEATNDRITRTEAFKYFKLK